MSNKSLPQQPNKSKSKTQLTYEVLTKLEEKLDAHGIVRQDIGYGKLLRIKVQNKIQLQNIIDIIHLILVTKETNITEIVFPHGANKQKKNGFMLYIKGLPHNAIKSIFAQTDMKWNIKLVEYERPENNNSSSTENEGNGGNGQLQLNDYFFESQYEIIVENAMKKMGIDRKEAENHICMWFLWKTQPNLHTTFEDYNEKEQERQRAQSPASSTYSSFFGGINGGRQIINPFIPDELQNGNNKNYKKEKRNKNQSNSKKNDNAISEEIKKSLIQAGIRYEPQVLQNLLPDERSSVNGGLGEVSTHFIARNENRGRVYPYCFDYIFTILSFCFIFLSFTILLYIFYTNVYPNEKHLSTQVNLEL